MELSASAALLQLGVLRFGPHEEGDVGISILPERKEILIGGFRLGLITRYRVSPADLQVCQSPNGIADQPDRDSNCPFCDPELPRIADGENRSVFAIKDAFPVTRGHLLVILKRHVSDYFEMTQHERADADDLIRLLRNRILAEDQAVVGFNIGVNSGEASGQTVMHAHIHLIPRRKGDVTDPRGGVRGVIRQKRVYPSQTLRE